MSNMLRSLARNRAKENMRHLGFRQFCKHQIVKNAFGFMTRVDSTFAEHWREHTNTVKFVDKRSNKKLRKA